MTTERQDDTGETIDPPTLEAMAWLARMQEQPASSADSTGLARWRAQSPEHGQAYEMVLAFRDAARNMPEPAKIVPFRRQETVSRRALLGGGAAIAASLAGFMAVLPPLGLWPSLAELMSDHRTAVGERFVFAPIAGVQFEMNTRTSVAVEDNGKSVRIIDGEAFVHVASRVSDFTVKTAAGSVRTRGAQFNIRDFNGRFSVVCAAGQLECAANARQARLTSGDQVTSTDTGLHRTRADLTTATAWRKGLLIFHGAPLSTVIAEINRYRSGRIILADESIGHRPVIGIFHTANIENTVNQIQQLLAVSATRLPGGVVLLG
jgi:transmembrane sensor